MNDLEVRRRRLAAAPPPAFKVGDRVEVWSTSCDKTDAGVVTKVWERYGGENEKDLYLIKLDAPLKSALPGNQVFEIGRGPESMRRPGGPTKTEMYDDGE